MCLRFVDDFFMMFERIYFFMKEFIGLIKEKIE